MIEDQQKVSTVLAEGLREYNATNGKMDLVMFQQVINPFSVDADSWQGFSGMFVQASAKKSYGPFVKDFCSCRLWSIFAA